MKPATLLLALVAGFSAPAAWADDGEEAATAAADAAASLALNPLAALDKSSLDGFRDLPLFTPSRTRPEPPPPVVAEAPPPPPPEEEAAPEPPPEPPTLKLSGIAEGPEGAVAFVAKEGEEVEQMRLGDEIDGWLVTSIDAQSLKLTLDDREQEYRLFVRSEESAAASSSDDTDSSSDEDDQQQAADRAARRKQQQMQAQGAKRPQKPQQKQQQKPEGEQQQ